MSEASWPDRGAHRPDHLPYWIAWQLVPAVGPVATYALLEEFGDLKSAWFASDKRVAPFIRPNDRDRALKERRSIEPAEWARRAADTGARCLMVTDPDYPPLLSQTDRPPTVLYLKGDLEALRHDLPIAVVGTRRCTRYGRTVTERIVGSLASAGASIVSGLAIGVDTLAHRTALDAGAPTVAVLPCGIDRVAPPRNRRLAELIEARGALVTEMPPGLPARPDRFAARNRIIAGLSLVTVVTEAGQPSGTLMTANAALDAGRDVLAVPGSVMSTTSAGANQLIRDGANLCRSADDVLAAINLEAVAPAPQLEPENPTQAAILKALGRGPSSIDAVGQQVSLPVHEVAQQLMLMELSGLVVPLGGGQFGAVGAQDGR